MASQLRDSKGSRGIMKILITGPESSGKTTLAKKLAQKYNYKYIPEYARLYLEKQGANYKYTKTDLLKIAQGQYDSIQSLKSNFIADTFLLNIKVWSEYKYGTCNPWIVDHILKIQFDKVLLLKPNTPWVSDLLRETPYDRDRLFDIFRKELEAMSLSYYTVDGENFEERVLQGSGVIGD